MKQKGFAGIIILVLIALTVVGYFGYKNYWPKIQSSISPTPTTYQQVKSDVSTWVTYQNDFCGSDKSRTKFSVDIPQGWKLSTKSEDMWASYTFINSDQLIDITCGEGFGNNCTPENQTSFTINGKKETGCYINGFGGAMVEKNGITFALTGRLSKDFLNQILSTFKFVDQSSVSATSNWKTYTNTKYGYEFKCPSSSTHRISSTSGSGTYRPLEEENCFEGQNQIGISVYPLDTTISIPEFAEGAWAQKLDSSKWRIFIRGFDKTYYDQILSTFKFID